MRAIFHTGLSAFSYSSLMLCQKQASQMEGNASEQKRGNHVEGCNEGSPLCGMNLTVSRRHTGRTRHIECECENERQCLRGSDG